MMTAEVLRVTEMKDEEVPEKTYHHIVRGSTYYDSKGRQWNWDHKGELKTTSRDLQAELDAIADKPGSPVYAKKDSPTPAVTSGNPVEEIQAKAAQAVAELERQRQGQK